MSSRGPPYNNSNTESAAFNGDPSLLSDFINIAPEEQAALSDTTKEPAIQETGKKVLKKRCDSKGGEILHGKQCGATIQPDVSGANAKQNRSKHKATSKEPEIQGPVKTVCIVKKGTACERFPHGGPGGLHPNDFPPGMPRGDFSAGMSRDDIPGMHPDAFPRRRYPDCPGRRYPNEFPSGSFREGSPLRVRGERMRPEMSDFEVGVRSEFETLIRRQEMGQMVPMDGNQVYKRTPEGSSTCSPVFEILENFRIETEGDAQMVLKITQKLTDILMEYRLRSFASPKSNEQPSGPQEYPPMRLSGRDGYHGPSRYPDEFSPASRNTSGRS